jgi:hypothetical protein
MRFAVLLCVLALVPAHAEVLRGELNTMESWKFIGRYCFLHGDESQIEYDLTLPSHSSIDILVYTESYFNWTEVHSSHMNCHEKHARAALTKKVGGGVYDTWDTKPDGDDSDNTTAERNETSLYSTVNRRGIIRVKALHKPRWFFVVMANCNRNPNHHAHEVQDSLRLKYQLTMTNAAEKHDRYHYHFSADEQGILQQELVFLVLQCLVVVFCYYECLALMRVRMFHYTVQLLAGSVVFHWIGILCKMVYYYKFSDTGERSRNWFLAGSACSGLAEMALLLLLILVAKGWTIVRAKLSASGRIKIAVYMTTYFVVYWMMLAWAEVGFDPAEVLYVYQSTPGNFLICLRIFAACWLLHAGFTTLTNYHAKRHFYHKFLLFSFMWIVSMPMMAAFCHIADNYVRAKIMNGIELAVNFVAHAILVGLYFPNLSCNNSFPFHAEHNPNLKKGGGKRKSKAPESAESKNASTNTASTSDQGLEEGAREGELRRRRHGNDREDALVALRQVNRRLTMLDEYSEALEEALNEIEDEDEDEMDSDEEDSNWRGVGGGQSQGRVQVNQGAPPMRRVSINPPTTEGNLLQILEKKD